MNAIDDQRSTSPDGYSPGYAQAAERILVFIAERNLRAGDRLPTEAQLGEQIGFSRTVTREAIKVLSALGRVTAQRGRGLFVAGGQGLVGSDLSVRFMPTNLVDVTMVFEFRRTQEAELARLAALRGAPADVNAVEEAAARGRSALDASAEEITRLDHDFHEAVAQAARNEMLSAAREQAYRLQQQSATLALAGDKGNVSAAADEHDAIARAIRRGDSAAAEEAAKAHLDRTYEDYYKTIQRGIFAREGEAP